MSKKTLALIVGLFLVTCFLLFLALRTPPYEKKVALGPTPTPQSVNAHTLLSLVPAAASQSSQTTQYTLAVQIDTKGNPVNSVQLELAYDPQALTNISVSPGGFFVQPTVLEHTINTVDGRISYALAEQIDLPGKKGAGNLVFVSFDAAPTFTGKTTQIMFLPKTAVAADRVLESVLKKAMGYTLTLNQTTPTASQVPTASSSGQ